MVPVTKFQVFQILNLIDKVRFPSPFGVQNKEQEQIARANLLLFCFCPIATVAVAKVASPALALIHTSLSFILSNL